MNRVRRLLIVWALLSALACAYAYVHQGRPAQPTVEQVQDCERSAECDRNDREQVLKRLVRP